MATTTVPDEIRARLRAATRGEDILWTLGTLRCRSLAPGESWLAATPTRIVSIERVFAGEASLVETTLSSVEEVCLAEDVESGVQVTLRGGGKVFDTIRFAAVERDIGALLAASLRAPSGRGAVAPPPDPDRPSVRVLPDRREVAPGDEVAGTLRLVVPRRIEVRAIRLHWSGLESASIMVRQTPDLDLGFDRGSQAHLDPVMSLPETEEHPWAGASVEFPAGARPVETRDFGKPQTRQRSGWPVDPGVHDHRFSFRVPPDAPPTFEGQGITIRYVLVAEVPRTDTWDMQSDGVEIRVGIPFAGRAREERRSASAADVTLHAVLQPGALEGGSEVRARLSVDNPRGTAVSPVQIVLRRKDTARVGDAAESKTSTVATAEGPAPARGAEIELAVNLPSQWCPFRGNCSQAEYELAARVVAAEAGLIEVCFPLRPDDTRKDPAK